MSSVPLPELPSLSSAQRDPESPAAGSLQRSESNTEFSTVLEGEQAALDTETRDSSRDLNTNGEENPMVAPAVVAEPADHDGKTLPFTAELVGLVVAPAPSEQATPVVLGDNEVLESHRAVMMSSDLGATLNRLMVPPRADVQNRAGVTVASLLQSGVATVAAPVNEVPNVAAEPLNTLAAAVHRAVKSDVLPLQAVAPAISYGDGSSTPLTTAQFAAVQALSEGSSTNAASMHATPALALTNTGISGVVTTSGLPSTTLDVPFRQAGWDGALGERVVWMVNQKLQVAEIKLNPPQLGPIEVRINMQNDQAQVTFTAQHASVREALEVAIPRLREMFGSAGLDLVDVGVSHQSFAQREGPDSRSAATMAESAAQDMRGQDEGDALTTNLPVSAASVIDLFA